MRKILIGAVFLLGAVFSGAAQQLPDIRFSTTSCPLDTLSRDSTKVSCVFTLENVGGSDLMVYQVSTGCRCLTVDFSRKPVPPGASCRIVATLDAGKLPIGPFRKEIFFSANTKRQYYRLFVTGVLVQSR